MLRRKELEEYRQMHPVASHPPPTHPQRMNVSLRMVPPPYSSQDSIFSRLYALLETSICSPAFHLVSLGESKLVDSRRGSAKATVSQKLSLYIHLQSYFGVLLLPMKVSRLRFAELPSKKKCT